MFAPGLGARGTNLNADSPGGRDIALKVTCEDSVPGFLRR